VQRAKSIKSRVLFHMGDQSDRVSQSDKKSIENYQKFKSFSPVPKRLPN
jgi:hypothetical protein